MQLIVDRVDRTLLTVLTVLYGIMLVTRPETVSTPTGAPVSCTLNYSGRSSRTAPPSHSLPPFLPPSFLLLGDRTPA